LGCRAVSSRKRALLRGLPNQVLPDIPGHRFIGQILFFRHAYTESLVPVDDQDIAWLLDNQASLDRRLERVENSLIFRTLRAIGRVYRRPMAGALEAYPEWRKRGGGTLPPPTPTANFAENYLVFSGEQNIVYEGALNHFAAAAPADVIYCDGEILNSSNQPIRPIFKPDWSPTLLRSVDYLSGLAAIRREHLQSAAGLRSAIALLHNPTVTHIPAIFYGSQTAIPPPPTNVAPPATEQLVSVVICTRTACLLETCLNGLLARTEYPPLELIVVQHLGSSSPPEEAAVEQVISTHHAKRIPYSGSFNFAAMNNLGASAASGRFLLFLNDDVTPLKPDWLRRLAAWLDNPSIGAAGAKLTFPDGTLQHSGVAAYMTDGAWHPGRAVPPSPLWPWNQYTREVSAVTGACLAIRAADLHRLGGFDPAFPVNFNDVDLCFRLQDLGLSVIVDVEAELQHDESRTRTTGVSYDERRLFFRKWAHRLQRPDPFYTPHLAQNTQEFHLR